MATVHTRKEALVLFAALFLLLACFPASGGEPELERVSDARETAAGGDLVDEVSQGGGGGRLGATGDGGGVPSGAVCEPLHDEEQAFFEVCTPHSVFAAHLRVEGDTLQLVRFEATERRGLYRARYKVCQQQPL